MFSIHSNQSSCCALLHFLSKCQSLCDDSGSGFQRLLRTPRVISVSDKKAEIFLFARNGEVLLHARLILANSDHFWRNSHFLSLYWNDARLPGFSAPFVWLFSLLVLFARLFLNSLDGLSGTAVTKEMEEVVIFFTHPSTSSHVDCSTAPNRPAFYWGTTATPWTVGQEFAQYFADIFCEFWYIYCRLDQVSDSQCAEKCKLQMFVFLAH